MRLMIESYSIDLLKALSIKAFPKIELALDQAMRLNIPPHDSSPKITIENIRAILLFHKNLVESTGNELLYSIYKSISYTLARYQFIYFHLTDTVDNSLRDHKRILGFLTDGKYDEAKDKLKRHIKYTMGLVRNAISNHLLFY